MGLVSTIRTLVAHLSGAGPGTVTASATGNLEQRIESMKSGVVLPRVAGSGYQLLPSPSGAGLDITAGNGIYGAWVEYIASADVDKCIFAVVGGQKAGAIKAFEWRFQVGFGAGGSEVSQVTSIKHAFMGGQGGLNDPQLLSNPCLEFLDAPIHVPAGTRVSIRVLAGSGADQVFKTILCFVNKSDIAAF